MPHDEKKLKNHYILVHEEGFPVRIEPGVFWDSRTEMNNVEFNERIDKILGEIGELTAESALTNEPGFYRDRRDQRHGHDGG
jgi:hypothetical protein